MTTSALNTARLTYRTTDENKTLVEEAACLLGQTVSSFAVGTLVERAMDVINTHATTKVTARDWDTINRLLASDAPPSDRLRQAATRYKERRG